MTRVLTCLAAALLLAVGAARADGDGRCPAIPKNEWKPPAELQRKLVEEGWRVRRIEATALCYEVYAVDPQGQRVEAFFHPQTFERVEKY